MVSRCACNEQWRYHHDADNPGHSTQQLLRLAALCPACHAVKHLGKANIDGRLDATLAQLAFVNGWTEAQCQNHARAAFDRWEQRSQMTWHWILPG